MAQQTTTLTFKLVFGAENIRRLTIAPTTLETFQGLLSTLYPAFYHPELTFSYTDSDGDAISVTTEPEWQEMLHLFNESKLVKINVISKNEGKFFKDGPEPEVVGLYKDGTVVEDEENVPLIDRATKALENLFPNQKILPYNVPSFLDEAVNFATNIDGTVDLKTDINKFFSALTGEACRLMETPTVKGCLDKAKALLISQQILEPQSPITFYNLACVEALTGNAQSAFNWLEQAVQNGYQNISHMIADPDLASLRGKEEWDNMVEKLTALVAAASYEAPSNVDNNEVEIETPSIPEAVPAAPENEVPVEVVPVAPQADAVPERPQQPAAADLSKWATQLDVLHSMGFLSDSLLVPSLEKHGSVEGALNDLLG